MPAHPNELNACGITEADLKSRLEIIRLHLGDRLPDEIKRADRVAINTLKRICECSVLLEALTTVHGFGEVKKQIKAAEQFSFDEPAGQWFQLRVGYLLTTIGEPYQFEQVLDDPSQPKDIVLTNQAVQIECKHF